VTLSVSWLFFTMHQELLRLSQRLRLFFGSWTETLSTISSRRLLRTPLFRSLSLYSKKREKYEDFLKSVKLLGSMDHYERSKLADALKEEKFMPGDYVIKEVRSNASYRFLIRVKSERSSI
jgi:hypothetical protein